MKVLVTGGTGFIGGAMVKRLCAEGVAVRAMVRDEGRAAKLAGWGAELVVGDLRDTASLAAAVRGCSHVVHAAAWVGADGDPDLIRAVNVTGTGALARAAATAGVTRFVHTSSTGVYGSPDQHGVTEDHPRRMSGQAYHDSKIEGEDAVTGTPGLSSVVLRPSHVYGPGSTHFTLRPFRMLLRGAVPLIAGGRYCFKPVWIGDLLDAMGKALHADLPSGTALNITAGHTLPWRTMFEGYAGVLGMAPRFRDIPLPVARIAGRLGDRYHRWTGRKAPIGSETVRVLSSDNSYANGRAAEVLGWTPATSWQHSLDQLRGWVADNGGPARFAGDLPAPLEVL